MLERLTERLPRALLRWSLRAPLAGAAGARAGRRGELVAVHAAAKSGAGADGGPRRDPRHRPRARGRHARLHGALPATPIERDLQRSTPEVDRCFVVRRRSRRCRRASRSCGLSRLGRAHAHARGRSRDELQPKFVGDARRAAPSRSTPPSLGPGLRASGRSTSSSSPRPRYEELQQRDATASSPRWREEPGPACSLDTDLQLNKPELVGGRRPRQARPTSACRSRPSARTLETMLGGRQVTRYKRDGEQYDVIVQVGAPRTATTPRRHRATSTCAAANDADGAARQRWSRCARR
ncbi:MAG: hypothetical protein MZW92_38020 [Comamonadaceae bacterium]|nr:hypothetical protein [Comamonadaceae bacterium]